MMYSEQEYRIQEALRFLLSERQRELFLTSASFRAEVEQLVRSVIPTMLRGIEAQAEEHDAARRKMIADLNSMLTPGVFNTKGFKP